MASSSQGILMSSPSSDQWWSVFHTEHGRDSEEEKAYLGFLSTHDIPGGSPAEVLAQAYTEFLAFIDASRDAPGEPEVAPKVLEARAEEVRAQLRVPRSSLSAPHLEKPMTAATRPPELREDAPPSPLTDPQAVQANVSTAGNPPRPGDPAPPPDTTTPAEPRHGRRGSEEGERR
jgi:hypothetical protein